MLPVNNLSAEICSKLQIWMNSCPSPVKTPLTDKHITFCHSLDFESLLRLNGNICFPTFGDLFHVRQFAIHKLHEAVGVFSRFGIHHGCIVAAE